MKATAHGGDLRLSANRPSKSNLLRCRRFCIDQSVRISTKIDSICQNPDIVSLAKHCFINITGKRESEFVAFVADQLRNLTCRPFGTAIASTQSGHSPYKIGDANRGI